MINDFKRMRRYGKSVEQVAEILEKSESLLLDDEKKNIRRKSPLIPPKDENEKPIYRSAYIKGFPIEEREDYQIVLV